MASTPYPVNNGAPPAYSQYENPVTKIELKISCRNLADMDFFSKSDPFVVIYAQTANKQWHEVDRTEVIMDNLNPEFVKSFVIDYFFEEQQMLKFDVYDLDDKMSTDLSKHDFIGRCITSLGSIVGENASRLEQPLQTRTAKDREGNAKFSRKSAGTIIIRAEEVNATRDVVELRLCGKKLDKKDLFGKSDPFLVFERCNEDNSFSAVHKTEVIKKTLNPTWEQFQVPAQILCNGDYDRTIRVTCYDWDRDGGHDLIGSFDLTLNDLKGFNRGRPSYYELINPKKAKKSKKYRNSGVIHILACTVFEKASFLDFIRGGMELAFVVAVDFTASNGLTVVEVTVGYHLGGKTFQSDPQTRTSLHYNGDPNRPSQYVQALTALGGVIEDYDTDKFFPAFGFGAKLPPNRTLSHDFALEKGTSQDVDVKNQEKGTLQDVDVKNQNFNPSNPNCYRVDGIIAAYYNTVNNVQLYGPTNFAPIINNTARLARESMNHGMVSQYYILLIITDGIISDMEKTKEAIVQAAKLPVSIIIVGVGNANFDAMEELDGDLVRLSYRGEEAERDIVQFVPFRDFMNNQVYNPASGVRLAKEVLHELPDQVTEYMDQRGIKPNPPPAYAS